MGKLKKGILYVLLAVLGVIGIINGSFKLKENIDNNTNTDSDTQIEQTEENEA